MIEAIVALLTAPFVILLIVLIVGAIVVVALYEGEPLCQYCNNDGDPCPRCGGYTERRSK